MIRVSPPLELSPSARRVLDARYLKKDAAGAPSETPEDMFARVAGNVASAEARYADAAAVARWRDAFLDLMLSFDFLPNSPTLMNAGTDLQQLSACFVLPVEDSMDGIFDAVKQAALIHKSGGGTGFSFSRLRPRNDVVRSTHGVSSGPVSFMGVFDAATDTVRQGGRRRGANMGLLRVDHPDILDFIAAKQDGGRLNNFNLSVAVTDAFMEALASDAAYTLRNPRDGAEAGTLAATDVWQRIVDGAWQNGEPGVVFIDRINRDNPTPAAGEIESTNPCGEQPLLPFESCNLGSINLARFTRGEAGSATVDFERLQEVVPVAVRFLDDVIDVNRYPLPQIREMTLAHRRIGLGVMGFADMLVRLGIVYDSPEAADVARDVMTCINRSAILASRELACERGAFPEFDASVYGVRGEAPRRNATVTTIAPTGSISIIAGVSSGVEPLFGVAFTRRILDGSEIAELHPLFEAIARQEGFYGDGMGDRIASTGLSAMDDVPERWRALFQTAHDVSPEGHIRIQSAFQAHTENAVSKTINLRGESERSDVDRALRLAFEQGCKGVTVYRDGSRALQVLSAGKQTAAAAASGRTPRARPESVAGTTRRMETGCGNVYVTTNETAEGPFELFAQIGKAGGCAASQTEAIGRLVSLALRTGVDAGAIARQLRGVRCPYPAWNRGNKVLSCADAIGQALELAYESSDTPQGADRAERLAGTCVECGGVLEFEGGCAVCRACGYSRC